MTQPSEQPRTECRPATTHRYEQVGLTRKCRRCGKTFGADAEAAAPDPVASPLDVARATVERIRERLADNHNTLGAEVYRLDQIYDILEEFGA